jgi:sn-1 stearoyl-lipid 9-desaturase
MAFIDRVLQEPLYGWSDEKGQLIVPTTGQLWREAFSRINVFRSKKNWISMMAWLITACMVPFLVVFLVSHFSLTLVLCAVVYSMIIMSTHGTIWLHRFCTHKSYKFSHGIWRFLTQNLVIKTVPEEIYVVSHHVHHVKSDLPGDPYNSRAGIMYCMLSDVNHQSINKNLSETDYHKAARFMSHTGVPINSYEEYRKWGSISNPFYTVASWFMNWAVWYLVFYLIGGAGLACALFAGAMFWFIFVRAFNYTGHGKGHVKHVDGIDFDRSNLSVNQTRPGLFSGEWHNNHHLYPGSARAGFLPYQIDLAWIYIFLLYKVGAVSSYHDSKKDFLVKYRNAKRLQINAPESRRTLARVQKKGSLM